MDAQAILQVTAAVVALTQLFKGFGVPNRWGLLVAAAVSVVGVFAWAFSHPDTLTRTAFWDYFAGWVTVLTSAAGVFGIIRASRENVTSMSGTGDGTAVPTGGAVQITNTTTVTPKEPPRGLGL